MLYQGAPDESSSELSSDEEGLTDHNQTSGIGDSSSSSLNSDIPPQQHNYQRAAPFSHPKYSQGFAQ
jgi:hypothetical protein